MRTDLSIIIPVYNNEKTLSDLTEGILLSLDKTSHSFEILYVNDCSRDNSEIKLKELSDLHDTVRHLTLDKNGGQHQAILRGIKYCKGDKVLVMDADLQDKPSMIVPLVEALKDDVDIVFVQREGIYQSLPRMLTSRLFKMLVRALTGLNQKAGTYFIVHRESAKRLLSLKCTYPFVTVMLQSISTKTVYLKSQRGNNFGKSSYSFSKRAKYAFRAIYCVFQCRFQN
ncbi:MAG: hypothetical protein Roseis2KO_57760 [Roseivirga sp.]